jgi:hypothetical protein
VVQSVRSELHVDTKLLTFLEAKLRTFAQTSQYQDIGRAQKRAVIEFQSVFLLVEQMVRPSKRRANTSGIFRQSRTLVTFPRIEYRNRPVPHAFPPSDSPTPASSRIEGVKVMPTSSPSGERKRLTV